MTISRALAAIPLVALLCSPLGAQTTCVGGASCAATLNLQLAVNYVARLSIGGTSSATTIVPAISASDFNVGFKDFAGPSIVVSANAPYAVTVTATNPNWSYSGPAVNPGKLAQALLWSHSAGGTYVSVTSASKFLPLTGTSSPATAGSTPQSIFYRANWSWTDPPGNYSIGVTFTLTSP